MKVLWVALLGAALMGCSENVKRNMYEAMRAGEQQRCLQQGTMNCPPGEDYDDYQRRRKELEQNP